MSYQNLLLNVTASIAVVTINRPEKLNALNSKTIEELKEVFTKINKDENIFAGLWVRADSGRRPKAVPVFHLLRQD